ncbi:MAG: YabP/YqfC family sporulation protein [Oscillospiraceae bacterium]|nr:YabP/YqfC family sporulation protein [Oscillospiraceae bacterium]
MNVINLAEKFDKLKSGFYKHSYIQMIDNTELVIDRCERITAYDENVIKLEMLNNTLTITGSGLLMQNFSIDGVIIKGKIHSAEFGEKKERKS